MTRELTRILFSSIFLFIFFAKIFIAVAPLIIEHFDRKSVNAVIMQLEIESETKDKNERTKAVKELYSFEKTVFIFTSLFNLNEIFSLDSRSKNHIQSFYPSVPTPPPNV